MEIQFQNLGPEKWHAQILLAPLCKGEDFLGRHPQLDKACPWLAVAPALRDFRGEKGELTLLHGHPELPIPRVLAIGLGESAKTDLDVLRGAIAAAVVRCRELGMESLLLPYPLLASLPGGSLRVVEEAVYAALTGLFRFIALKTDAKEIKQDPRWLAVGFEEQEDAEPCRQAARRGESSANAVILARTLDSMPSNMLYPQTLADKAQELADACGFDCIILDESRLAEEGMGCLLAVGSGSVHPPRLIVLEHAPKDHENDKPIIFVGKGLTFDSGGLCLKPAANMWEMKSDMSGAAAVLAAIDALAAEGTPRRIIGILACAENMPDGKAFRPGDVLKSSSGMTVEVLNTDAEGRLALCDALSYAQKKWSPAGVVDIATLTGACAVALGSNLAGLFCDDDRLVENIEANGTVIGENFWRLPLWEPYMKDLDSEIADIAHTASRIGGAITAALFLKKFMAPEIPWAHLDIAGVDWNAKAKVGAPAGPTGFGTRTLLELGRGGLK